jgi:hypothetical protein
MKAIREVERFDERPEALTAMCQYAERLVERGDTNRFGVFVERVTGGWAVMLIDRQYAPTREAARRKACAR